MPPVILPWKFSTATQLPIRHLSIPSIEAPPPPPGAAPDPPPEPEPEPLPDPRPAPPPEPPLLPSAAPRQSGQKTPIKPCDVPAASMSQTSHFPPAAAHNCGGAAAEPPEMA